MRDMGKHRLKDLERPERVYQMVAVDLPQNFPPPQDAGRSSAQFAGQSDQLRWS